MRVITGNFYDSTYENPYKLPRSDFFSSYHLAHWVFLSELSSIPETLMRALG